MNELLKHYDITYEVADKVDFTIRPLFYEEEKEAYIFNEIFSACINDFSEILESGRDNGFNFNSIEKAKMSVIYDLAKQIMPRMHMPKGLYLMESKKLGCYKIGISKDPYQRMENVQRDMDADDIKLLYFIPNYSHLERKLHKEFSHLNKIFIGTKGTKHKEWFEKDEVILKKIEKLWKINQQKTKVDAL